MKKLILTKVFWILLLSTSLSQSIQVTSPNGLETLYSGKTHAIKWTSANITSNIVKLEYSTNKGVNWKIIHAGTTNSGSYTWTLPTNDTSSACLIKVSDFSAPNVFDVSDTTFKIIDPFIQVTYPNGGEILTGCKTERITWKLGGIQDYVKLYYSTDNGNNWIFIVDDYIANNTNYYDFSIPSISTSAFKIKVEAYYDNKVSDIGDTQTTINQDVNKLIITSPNGGESWSSSSTKKITWLSEGVVGNVSIQYSTNEGSTWAYISNTASANNIANTGSYDWVLPSTTSILNTQLRIYEYSKNCNIDYSNNSFIIDKNPAVSITFPNNGEKLYIGKSTRINWSASNLPTNYVKIEYSTDNGTVWNTITTSRYNYGYYDWTIPNTPSTQCLLRISAADNSAVYDICNTPFIITPQTITVLTPNGGESLIGCTNYQITWNQEGVQDYVKLYYSTDNGINWVYIADSYIANNSNYYNWSVPSISTANLKIKVEGYYYSAVKDSSDNFTSVSKGASAITITSPNGKETIASSSNFPITWTNEGTVGNVTVRYSTNNGTTWTTASGNSGSANNIVNTGNFEWLVPANLVTSNALIQVYEYSKNCVSDFSDTNFTINNDPIINITSPSVNQAIYGGKSHRISWSSSNLPTNYVKIEVSSDSGTTWSILQSNRYNYGYYDWAVPKIYSDKYLLRIKAVADTTIADISKGTFKVIPQKIEVLTPNGNDSLIGCTNYQITWKQEGVQDYVKLYYSVDDGINWVYITDSYIANNSNYYNWSVPSLLTEKLKVKVAAYYDAAIYDTSDVFSKITKGPNAITITSPNGNETIASSSNFPITWTNDGTVGNVTIRYSTNKGNTWNSASSNAGTANNIANTGSYEWLVPANLVTSEALIQVYDYSKNCVTDFSDTNFTINNNPIINITSPAVHQAIYAGKSFRINWSSSNLPTNYVKIEVSSDSGATWSVIQSNRYNYGYYDWAVPKIYSDKYLVRIKSVADTTIADVSKGTFKVVPQEVIISSPNGKETLPACGTHRITWSQKGVQDYLKLYYSIDGGNIWSFITDAYIGGNSTYYDWKVPSIASNKVLIKASAYYDETFFDISDTLLSINQGPNYVTLVSPNGSEDLSSSSVQKIIWTNTGTVGKITLRYSLNGGTSWSTVSGPTGTSANNISNTGSFDWLVPANTNVTTCLIQVYEYSQNCVVDNSDNYFSINNNPNITITTPNGGEKWYFGASTRINWSSTNLPSNYVNITYSVDSGATWKSIINNRYNYGYYDWTIPSITTNKALIKISAVADTTIFDISNATFNLATPKITLLTPNTGNENWLVGENKTITWSSDGLTTSELMKLEYSANGGASWSLIKDSLSNSGTYIWTIPNLSTTSQSYIKISSKKYSLSKDSNDFKFTITKPIVGITIPNDGQTWYVGESKSIQWTGIATSDNVKLELSSDSGSTYTTIVASIPNNGQYFWLIPYNTPISKKSFIRISDVNDTTNFDISDTIFTIAKPTLSLTSPIGNESWYLGQTNAIKWTNVGFSSSKVKIEYSANNETSWQQIALANNTGNYSWTIPSSITPSTTAKIKLSNENDTTIFSVNSIAFKVVKPSVTLTSPNGGETVYLGQTKAITWDKDGAFSPNVSIAISANNGQTWSTIIASVSNNGFYTWTPNQTPGNNFIVRVRDAVDTTISDVSNAVFKISKPTLTITYPNGTEILDPRGSKVIRWQSAALTSTRTLKLEVSSDAGATWSTIIASTPNTGTYTWDPTGIPYGTQKLIRITDLTDNTISDVSNAVFTIASPALTLTSPNGGEQYFQNQTKAITWSSKYLSTTEKIKIELNINNTSTWTIIEAAAPNSGSYNWNIPASLSTQAAKIRITNIADNSLIDTSNATFAVGNPKVGDKLSTAIVVNSLPTTLVDTSSNYSNQYSGTGNQASGDVFYTFSLPTYTDSISATVSANFQVVLHLLDQSGNLIKSSTGSSNYTFGSGDVEAGKTYFLVVEGLNSTSGRFQINLKYHLFPIDLETSLLTSSKTELAPNDSVNLNWTVKNLGLMPSLKDWTERIYMQSSTGQNKTLLKQITFKNIDSLASNASIQRSTALAMPSTINVGDNGVFVVEVIPSATINEPSTKKANNTTVQENAWTIKKQLTFTLSNNVITEGSSSSITGKVVRSGSVINPLTFTVSVSKTDKLTLPSTVSIPAGQSQVSFSILAPNNDLIEGTLYDTVKITSTGYPVISAPLSILDNDKPSLTITNLATSSMEGDTVRFTVSTNLVHSTDLQVFLTSSNSTRLPLPSSITIPAGSLSKNVSIPLIQDLISEVDLLVNINAGANNHTSVTESIQINDDDLPSLELVLESNVVSESGGPFATKGYLRRKAGSNSLAFTTKLTTDIPNTLIFPATISLAAGEMQKSFNVGVIDNDQVDGERLVTLNAAIYMSSCGCSAPPTSSGSVSATITINDNDGPTLKITSSQLTFPEGYNGIGYLRISRNTETSKALEVSLISSNTNEATVPSLVEIPFGKTYVDVPVTTINDNATDGNQQVYFQASALDFATGSIWIIVTDQNLPDFTISSVELSSDSVQAASVFSYQVKIKNEGFATAPTGLIVKGYLSKDDKIDDNDLVLSIDTIKSSIPAGQTFLLQNAKTVPNIPKGYQLIYKANPDLSYTELVITNNTSVPKAFYIKPEYSATAIVDAEYFTKGSSVLIHGSTTKTNGSPALLKPVEIYIITQGIRRTISATTDANGNYEANFLPLSGESGHYIVGASYPGMELSKEQDNFDIMGVLINNGQIPSFKVTLGDTLLGVINITNQSSRALTNFTLSPIVTPEGAIVKFNTIATLGGYATATLSYSITDSTLSPGTQFEVMKLAANADQGLIQNLDVRYYCQAPKAHLIFDRKSLDVKASQSAGSYQVEIAIVNNGQGETGKISVVLPNLKWLESITPTSLASISQGDTSIIILKFLATEEVPFNYPVRGSIVVNSENSNAISLPFSFEKVSETTGTVKVLVTNQFTYFAEGEPKVDKALVKIRNYFSGELYAEGYTDVNGIFIGSEIPEGKHKITVEKDKHVAHSGTIEIIPGDTLNESIFLRYQAITFDWSVEPSAIEDKYDITLETTFETNIPMPVVTIEMPKSMPQLSGNETYAFNVTLTNKGLISAENVTLNLPLDDTEYEWITNYEPGTLIAQQSIQVPVIMKRRSAARPIEENLEVKTISEYLGMARPDGSTTLAKGGDRCTKYAGVVYSYKCNLTTGLWDKNGVLFTMKGRTCVSSDGPSLTISIRENLTSFACAACPVTTLQPIGNSPVYTFEKKTCKECMDQIYKAVKTCIKPGGGSPSIKKCFEPPKDFMTLKEIQNYNPVKKCVESFIPKPIKCFIEMLKVMAYCGSTSSSGRPYLDSNLFRRPTNSSNEILDQFARNFQLGIGSYETQERWIKEYFGDIIYSDSWFDLEPLLYPYVDQFDSIPASAQQDILTYMNGYELPQSSIQTFFERWNTSMSNYKSGIYEPTSTNANQINWNKVKLYLDTIADANIKAEALGYESIDDLLTKNFNEINDYLEEQSQAVCASVKVQFSQELTMTREAFNGTLEIFNGHPTDAMDSLSVSIQITDEDGLPANGHFEIQTSKLTNIANVSGTGKIDAQMTSSAKFIFIPELTAAPTTPKKYNFGGTVRYWDPYAQAMVNMPLSPVQLTVNPSPNLMLHYFMQRNILGDDALTQDKVEPIVPADLAVMIENQGYGPAVNVSISSAQPKIVENEKGLSVDFKLIGSNFQGQPKQLGVTNINFGIIPPLESRVGQWYFTSSLLGKFVSYDAKVVHSNSFGNPELSLVKGIEIHELTHSIKAYGPNEDAINDFLVNDYFDVKDRPDIIYFSQGNRTKKVYEAGSASFSSNVAAPSFTNVLTARASDTGWNYVQLPDPGNNLFDIVSVTRQDGQVIPLNNAWLTFVTLPAGKQPLYENKFHFVDDFTSLSPKTYTIVWRPKDLNTPNVVSIGGAPESVTSTQVDSLVITFSKPIKASSFTYEDLNLTFQGSSNLIDENVIISQIDSVTFVVDLSAFTIGNGFYNFSVQAAHIEDIYGIEGKEGKNVTWSQFLDIPTVQNVYGIPTNKRAAVFNSIQLEFNLEVDTATINASRFKLYKDSVEVIGMLSIDSISPNNKLFFLSGFENLMKEDGSYQLVIELDSIRSKNGKNGIGNQTIKLILDASGPKIVELKTSTKSGLDNQHVTFVDISFDEQVSGFNTASVKLTRDGQQLFLNIAQLTYPDNRNLKEWQAGNFGLLTYPEGVYEFSVTTNGLKDDLGNLGNNSSKISWTVNRTNVIEISNLAITPDLGKDSTDGITSTLDLNLKFNLSANAKSISIKQKDLGGETTIKSIDNVAAGNSSIPIKLLVSGNTSIKITATNEFGVETSVEKLLFIDVAPLKATWKALVSPTPSTQIDTVYFTFSEKVLNESDILGATKLSFNNQTITGFSVGKIDSTHFYIYGIKNASSLAGTYNLSIDLSKLMKNTSGQTGNEIIQTKWEVKTTNTAPVANAGTDQTITSIGLVTLDASASSDAENDYLTYSWIAPNGIVIKDINAVQTTFEVTNKNQAGVYSILLIVNDGTSFSTDKVVISINLAGEFVYYKDADGDGYGVFEDSLRASNLPQGYVINYGDCDDTDASINPNATEITDNIDNNCNGLIDENVTAIEDLSSIETFTLKVYPVPTIDQFKISLNDPNDKGAVSIRIYNELGMLIEEIDSYDGSNDLILGETYSSGSYTIVAIQGRVVKTYRMIKQK